MGHGQSSRHLHALAFPVVLHKSPILWTVSPSRETNPDNCLTSGWYGESISTGHKAGVFAVPLGTRYLY